ncbi:MAG TPA: hypothetical protein VGC70_13095 [Burkholderiales bacterium]|jgi:hypothetical protein
MSEWDGIEGFESWSRKLRSLLDAAADAAKQTNHDSRFAMSERLTQFVENSYPNDEKIRALDDIASKAAIGLLEQNIDERLKSIVTRNTELAQRSKQFDIGGEDARASAASIRFERTRKTLDVLNNGVETMNDLRSTLKTGTDRQLIASLDKAVIAAQKVRELLRKS